MTNYIFYILTTVLLYSVLGVTFNLIMGYAGIISLAHAVFFGVGAYATALLELRLGIPLPLAFLSSVVVSGLLGMGFISLIGRTRGDYLVVVTLGLQLVFLSVLVNLKRITGGNNGLTGISRPGAFGYRFNSPVSFAMLTLVICAVIVGIAWWISRSPFGRSLKALREDEIGMQSLGKNVFRYKWTIFAVSAALAGAAGSIYAPYQQFINPDSFQLWESIVILVVVVVGGAGNLWGSVVGAVIMVALPEALRFVPITSGATAQLREVLFGVALLLVVVFRPQGLFGEYKFGAVRRTADVLGQAIPRARLKLEYEPLGLSVVAGGGYEKAEEPKEPILEIDNLSKSFSGIRAIDDVSLRLRRGKVTGIIGPNGAGKSTLFDLVCGYTKVDSGEVRFGQKNITNLSPHVIARLGIGRSFQAPRLFGKLSVTDNVIVALQPPKEDEDIFRNFRPGVVKATRQRTEQANDLLGCVGLAHCARELAENLSYADQKLLVLARLLAFKSELLLLDELAAGLDQQSTHDLAQVVHQLAETGITVCLVEHNLDFVKDTVDTILFLEQGRLIAAGSPDEIMKDKRLSRIYFGSAV
jgi:branched-chain amino acid transport system permease protein